MLNWINSCCCVNCIPLVTRIHTVWWPALFDAVTSLRALHQLAVFVLLDSQTALCFVGLGRMKLVNVTFVNRISVKKFRLEHS
jgi:hypothetical protein